jgi:hypothetical protein
MSALKAGLVVVLFTPPLLGQSASSWVDLYSYEGQHSFQKYGDGIAAAGDVDWDGVADFMIGARESTFLNAAITPGSITMYSGATGLPIYRIDGTSHTSALGTVMCTLGDINGDGAADFIAGDPMYSIGSYTFEGAFWVYSGSDGSVIFWDTGTPSSFFGNALALLDDLDADGLPEFAVGAPNEGSGMVHVYSPGKQKKIRSFAAPDPNANFGVALASIGDLNNDGHQDLIVGANRYDGPGGNDIGAAYLISSRDGSVLHRFDGWDSLNEFGKVVASIGDLDGDGCDDVMVSAPHGRLGLSLSVGIVEVYSSVSHALIYNLTGNNPNETFGASLVNLGDQNGDASDDFLIGVPYRNTNGIPGVAVLYSGASGLVMNKFGTGLHLGFGHHLANLGDLDGDGYADIGISSAESLSLFQGSASIYGSRKYLSATHDSVSAAAGGPVDFLMDFDRIQRGFSYRLLASSHGTGPSIINGLEVPLGWDFLLNLTSLGSFPGFVANGDGVLDGDGNGICNLVFPALVLSPYAGQNLYFAAIAGSSLLAPTLSSEAVALTITP